YQKPSVSLMILIGFCTASSYTIGIPCVERQDEAFFCSLVLSFSSWENSVGVSLSDHRGVNLSERYRHW
ncbi:MAG TPA: hypothetical protein VLL97_03030, partial [Acidobacteriota bacterium]|nr:hypothetical protein [Acidobacteriota bacterium]